MPIKRKTRPPIERTRPAPPPPIAVWGSAPGERDDEPAEVTIGGYRLIRGPSGSLAAIREPQGDKP